MKKFLSLILVMALTAGLTACSGAEDAASDAAGAESSIYTATTINLAHGYPEGCSAHQAALKFEELVEGGSGGTVQIELFPNQQLGNDREFTEACIQGNVDMGVPSTTNAAGLIPTLNVLEAPFVVADRQTMYDILDGEFGKQLLDTLEDCNLKGLGFWENGFRELTANKEIHSLQDLSGLKIRVMENNLHIDMWKNMGANPSPLKIGELYMALQQKSFDAQENPLELIYNSKFYEVQPYVYMTNHIYTAYVVFMSMDKWNSLNAETQMLVQEAVTEATAYQRELCIQSEKDCRDAIDDSGVSRVYEPSAELRNEMVAAAAPIYDMVRSDAGDELVDAYFEAAGFKGFPE